MSSYDIDREGEEEEGRIAFRLGLNLLIPSVFSLLGVAARGSVPPRSPRF